MIILLKMYHSKIYRAASCILILYTVNAASVLTLQSPYGCPSGVQDTGVIRLEQDEAFHTSAGLSHFTALRSITEGRTRHYLRLAFCSLHSAWPDVIRGPCCVFTSSSSCPHGFLHSSLSLQLQVNWTSPFVGGALPHGDHTRDSKTIHFCCQSNPLVLPMQSFQQESFSLVKVKEESCPALPGLSVSEEYIQLPKTLAKISSKCTGSTCPDITEDSAHITLNLCLYTRASSYPSQYPSVCEEDWGFYGGHCYWFSDRRYYRQEALEDCATRGATLASITSTEEREFVTKFALTQNSVSSRVWIGMYDYNIEGAWEWVSGEPFDHSVAVYARGEPNDKNRVEDCGDMWAAEVPGQVSGQWNDEYCSFLTLNYVCKRLALEDGRNMAYQKTARSMMALMSGLLTFLLDNDSCNTSVENITTFFKAEVSDSNVQHASMISSICVQNVSMKYLTTFAICENTITGRFLLVTMRSYDNLALAIQASVKICEIQVFGEEDTCSLPLGLSTGRIASLDIRVSSQENDVHRVRLGSNSHWCPDADDRIPRITIDLGEVSTITGLAITSLNQVLFALSYDTSDTAATTISITDKIFEASATDVPVYLPLAEVIVSTVVHVTFLPTNQTPCVTLELYGCVNHTAERACRDTLGYPVYKLGRSGLVGLTELGGMVFDCPAAVTGIQFYAHSAGIMQLVVIHEKIITHVIALTTVYGVNDYTLSDDVKVTSGDSLALCCDVTISYANSDDADIVPSELMLAVQYPCINNASVADVLVDTEYKYSYLTIALKVSLKPYNRYDSLKNVNNISNKTRTAATSYPPSSPSHVTITQGDYSKHCDVTTWNQSSFWSPNYPQYYGGDVTCSWRITVPLGRFIKITMLRFDLEHKVNPDKLQEDELCKDTLSFFNTSANYSGSIYQASGKQFPLLMISQSQMEIVFLSCVRQSPQHPLGFLAVVELTECGGCDIGIPSQLHYCNHHCGFLASPNFPHNYDHASDILWMVTVPFGHYVALNFTLMEVESSYPDCLQDRVIVNDVTISGDLRVLGVNCVANQSAFPYYSSWNQLQVRLVTDKQYSNTGFYADYHSKRYDIDDELKSRIIMEGNGCPEKGVLFDATCYMMIEMASGVTWLNAYSICHRLGGYLVTIMDPVVMTVLHYLLTTKWFSSHPSFYIGLSDAHKEGIYSWADGRPMVYSAWANASVTLSPQPDGGSLENCAVIRMETLRATNQWHDVPCSKNQVKRMICQVAANGKNQSENHSEPMHLLLRNTTIPDKSLARHLWHCDNGEVISITSLCDAVSHCSDSSDEKNCSVETEQCGDGRFRCGDSAQCIPVSLVCDYKNHCENAADEINCVSRQCGERQFTCDNGECIDAEFRCNLLHDCQDQSDEKVCVSCSKPSTFQCFDGGCLPWNVRCDNIRDCSGCVGEDEYMCFWSPFSLCETSDNIHCKEYPEQRYGEVKFDAYWQNSYLQGEDKEVARTSVAYLGITTDDDLVHVIKRSLECRQSLVVACDPSSVNWTSIIDRQSQLSNYCDRIPGEKTCEVTLREPWIIPVKQLSVNSTACSYDKNPIHIGPFICKAEMKIDEFEGYFTCGNGQRVLEKYRCIYEVDEYKSHLGCRDMSHLQNCDEIPVTETECKQDEQGMLYRGTMNVTQSGLVCQRWDSQYPHSHPFTDPSMFGVITLSDVSNYCRNVGGQLPWCFTTNTSVVKDYCDIPLCGNATTQRFECPRHYYMCPHTSYCIPARYICDGELQCPQGDDEVSCEELECPEHYRCQESGQCLPLEQVCDGRPQCPLADDEVYCSVTCPVACDCQALSADCQNLNLTSIPADFDQDVRQVKLQRNSVKHIMASDLHYPFLIQLCLSHNALSVIEPGSFQMLRNLRMLDLSFNRIKILYTGMFRGLESLKVLNLQENYQITSIETLAFDGLGNLPSLYMSGLTLTEIVPFSFFGLEQLKHLTLTNAGVNQIGSESFSGLKSVEQIDLSGNSLLLVKTAAFSELKTLRSLKSDTFRVCCMARQVPRDQCLPPEDPISSCEDLMSNAVLRAFIWILGILACCGNAVVVCLRCKNPWTNVPDFIISNLAVSDFQMGVYMLIIASVDMYYQGRFVEFSDLWRKSALCTLAGVLATFANEASIAFLVLLTTDRFFNIAMPFSTCKLKMRSVRVAVAMIWCGSLVLSVLPACGIPYFGDSYYGRSSVCVPLPITSQRPQGWEYATVVFLYLNLAAFTYIGVAYIIMYISVRRSMALTRNMARSGAVARNMALIVLTDFLCWMPVCALGLAALQGATIPGSVYAWVIVFVLPVNSAINPILYTFSTKHPIQSSRTWHPLLFLLVLGNCQIPAVSSDEPMIHSRAVSISSIKALEGHRVAALSVLDSRGTMTLRDYLRSDCLTLRDGVRLLTSLTETIVALQDLGLVHGRIDAARVYVDWDSSSKEPVGVRLSGLRDAQVMENEDHAKEDVIGIGMVARDLLTAWAMHKNKTE